MECWGSGFNGSGRGFCCIGGGAGEGQRDIDMIIVLFLIIVSRIVMEQMNLDRNR